MPSQQILDHWTLVSTLGCLISQQPDPTLHHCHGGSMERFGTVRGKSQKPSDWLVIPIHERYHTGQFGIDSGGPYYGVVESWESEFGSQVGMLMRVCDYVGYDVFEKAGLESPWNPPKPKWMTV